MHTLTTSVAASVKKKACSSRWRQLCHQHFLYFTQASTIVELSSRPTLPIEYWAWLIHGSIILDKYIFGGRFIHGLTYIRVGPIYDNSFCWSYSRLSWTSQKWTFYNMSDRYQQRNTTVRYLHLLSQCEPMSGWELVNPCGLYNDFTLWVKRTMSLFSPAVCIALCGCRTDWGQSAEAHETPTLVTLDLTSDNNDNNVTFFTGSHITLLQNY